MKNLDNKGNVAIILCLLITALFGFMAYVIDIGLIYAEKTKLSNAIDSAALAAMLELPKDKDKAIAVATEYLIKNNVDPNMSMITVSDDLKHVQIETEKNVKHFFAPLIGINSSNLKVTSKAVIAPVKFVKDGIRPFAVEVYNFSYGDVVTLKEGAGSGYHGNYGAVALGGNGANVFKANALYGYTGTIAVGDLIYTETGDMAGAANQIKNYINSEVSTFDNFPRNSIRLWTIPLVNTLQVNGKGQILVVGFGEFYVEDVSNKAGKIEVSGRFVRYVRNATVDETLNDTGAYGSKLAK